MPIFGLSLRGVWRTLLSWALPERHYRRPAMPTPHAKRWLRKFWGAVCVIAGLASIAAGLESVILE